MRQAGCCRRHFAAHELGWLEHGAGRLQRNIIGKCVYDLIAPEDRERYREFNERICRGERASTEFDIVGLKGERRHLETHAAPLQTADGSCVQLAVTLDITERQRAEQALRESEQRFRMITEAAPIMVWMSGTDKLCYYFNRGWLDFVGRTLEEELGNGWAENVHPDDFERCLQIYVESFDARRPFEMEYRLRHHNGQYRWILDHAVPRYAPGGTFEGYVGGCLDIDDQKEAAEKVRIASETLRESEERLRLAQQVGTIGTFEWNVQTNVNRWTPELETIYGLQPGEFAGTQEAWEQMLHPEDKAAAIKQVEVGFQTGAPVQAEWRAIWPDGSIHWILGRWQVFRDDSGEPTRMTGINIDITSRKEAEQALRRLAAIVESSDDAIVGKDLNGIVTNWNPGAEKMFGYSAEEMVGRPITTIIPAELQEDEQRILTTIGRGERVEHFETVRLTKSGERIDVSLTVSPVRDEAGKVIGAAKTARDITQQKKTEQALRMTERLASVGRMAATVAHEINNPLEAVTNLVYLAKGVAARDDVREYLNTIEEELNRISHITKQTLGFYRETIAPSAVRVGEMLNPIISLLGMRLRNKGIEIRRGNSAGSGDLCRSGRNPPAHRKSSKQQYRCCRFRRSDSNSNRRESIEWAQSDWNTDYNCRFRAGHSAVCPVETFRAVFHYQARRRNGSGALGLHEHRAETPWIDSCEEQHESRAELDCLLRVSASEARIGEQHTKSESMKKIASVQMLSLDFFSGWFSFLTR